jgi:hypothetical protein
VQIGYAECGFTVDCNPDGPGLAIPNDGVEHFVYTYEDDSGGYLFLADGWYGDAPIVGHIYRMKITSTVSGGDPKWQYCIRDATVGQNYVCRLRPRTWRNNSGQITDKGQFAWWGAETHNDASQLGAGSSDPYQVNERAEYQWSGDWYWVDKWDAPAQVHHACDHYSVQKYPTGTEEGTYPSYYRCYLQYVYDTNNDGFLNDQDAVEPVTNSH